MATKMTKAELIDILSSKTKLKSTDIHLFIDSLFVELKSVLLSGSVVELRGFGTFEQRTLKGKANARNPKTGESVVVEDHGVVSFRAGKQLKTLAKQITHREEV